MTRLLSIFFFLTSTFCLADSSVEVFGDCPTCALERCFWRIGVSSSGHGQNLQVDVDWVKGIQSLHTEKPFAESLKCNVDREFNDLGGGFIVVNRELNSGRPENCLVSKPGDCGVEFKMIPGATSPSGFTVKTPSGGKLTRVSHFSTLKLQCGDFTTGKMNHYEWNADIGWDGSSGKTIAKTKSFN